MEAKGAGAGSEEVVRAMAAVGDLGVQPRGATSSLGCGLEFGVDQKSYDQWVMSMTVAVSYDERGEARDTVSYCIARGRPGVERGRCALVDHAAAALGLLDRRER